MTTPARTPARKSRCTRVKHGVAAAVALEALEIEPEPLRALPQMRVLESPLIGEQRVVHLPEAALQPGRLGRAGRGPGARVAGADREVAEHEPRRAVAADETQVQRGAERALEIARTRSAAARPRRRGRGPAPRARGPG